MTVIVTGGLAELFAKESIKIHHHIKYLTLDGMKLVYEWSQ